MIAGRENRNGSPSFDDLCRTLGDDEELVTRLTLLDQDLAVVAMNLIRKTYELGEMTLAESLE